MTFDIISSKYYMNIKKKNIAVKKARAIRSRKILLAKCLSYARRVARRKKKKKETEKKGEGKGVDKEAGRGEEERSCLGSWTIKSD